MTAARAFFEWLDIRSDDIAWTEIVENSAHGLYRFDMQVHLKASPDPVSFGSDDMKSLEWLRHALFTGNW